MNTIFIIFFWNKSYRIHSAYASESSPSTKQTIINTFLQKVEAEGTISGNKASIIVYYRLLEESSKPSLTEYKSKGILIHAQRQFLCSYGINKIKSMVKLIYTQSKFNMYEKKEKYY